MKENGRAAKQPGRPELSFILTGKDCKCALLRSTMTMTTIADFYRPVLTSKWFYISIVATVFSYIALNESLYGFVHDYLRFGPDIASFHIPLLRFFFLSFRYSVPLTEIAILSNEWYTPIAEPKFADASPAAAKPLNLDPLAFNPETGVLSYHGKTCEIPFKTYQHTLCAKLFDQPGGRVPEKDIIRAIDWEMDKSDSYRLVKDAVYAVNAKAKTAFGVDRALLWEKLTAWVNDAYLA